MATPNYQGAGQPVADNGGGLLAGLAALFGGGTPAYAGKGQSSQATSGGGTPAYASAPVAPRASTIVQGQPFGPDSIALVIPRDLIEQP